MQERIPLFVLASCQIDIDKKQKLKSDWLSGCYINYWLKPNCVFVQYICVYWDNHSDQSILEELNSFSLRHFQKMILVQ